MVFWELADPAEVLEGFGSLVAGHEPAGRFFDEEQADEHHSGGYDLYCEWNDPLCVRWLHRGTDSVLIFISESL